MAELESKIQSRIIKRLEAEGYYVVKLILTSKAKLKNKKQEAEIWEKC